MTTSGICELFNFARPRRRKNGGARIISGWKMAFVLTLLFAATAIASPAQTFRTLAHFNGTNGANSWSPLVQGLDGNFYGTTTYGGAYGYGTIFTVTRGGTLTTLYSFCSQTGCPDGSNPVAGLVLGTDGDFYGTTMYGGLYNLGTFFRISAIGALTTFHSFADGAYPSAALVQATDGNFYGLTLRGGHTNKGIIFRITPTGTLTRLHSFCVQTGCTDGWFRDRKVFGVPGVGTSPPLGGLIQATDGNLYGTTSNGGTNLDADAGTVFRITLSGQFTTLHSFCPVRYPCPDGAYPVAGLVQATDGTLYGTTSIAGPHYGGTVFKITPGGMLTTLYSFCAQTNCVDGTMPLAPLVQATDGNFYGTTMYGGDITSTLCTTLRNYVYGCGTVFKISSSGVLTTLHSFDSLAESGGPNGLVQGTNGVFYGTTSGSEPWPEGTIFSLGVGLGWSAKILPNYGTVGANIDILGTNLTAASDVTFNGTSAAFTVVTPTLIQTSVPPGATTGYVRVTLPGGRIPSNKKFRVTPQITSFTPPDGPVGTLVTITGVSLAQTWAVTIHGTHASFTVVDDGTVTITVPTGATTGTIRVAGPGGAATSTTNFTVN